MRLPYSRCSALVGIALVLSGAFLMPPPRLGAGRDRDRVVRVARGGSQRPGSGGSASHVADDAEAHVAAEEGVQQIRALGVSMPSGEGPLSDTSTNVAAPTERFLPLVPIRVTRLLRADGDERGYAQNGPARPAGRAPPAA